MSGLHTLRFYATPEHSCSYLAGRSARTLFVDPQAEIEPQTFADLMDMGFRRSGMHIYRPHCDGCDACISVRIPVQRFRASRTQRRIWNRNRDLRAEWLKPEFTTEVYELYARYICARHSDGDMYPPSSAQFLSFLVESNQNTQFLGLRDAEGRLLCVAVIDHIPQGISAVYTFYDPTEEKRSLGTYAVLWQIQETLRREKHALYLGYWVESCRKMTYKTSFHPLEVLYQGQWFELLETETAAE